MANPDASGAATGKGHRCSPAPVLKAATSGAISALFGAYENSAPRVRALNATARRDLGSASSLILSCGARLRAVSLTGNRHTDGHMQTIKQAAANTFGDQDQQQADQQP